MNKTIIITILVLMITMSSAFAGLGSCDFIGNHYDCTAAELFSNPGTITAGTYGIYVYDSTHTVTGTAGTSSVPNGQDLTYNIITTGGVFMDNVTLLFTGGEGWAANNAAGGAGGDVELIITSGTILINNSQINFTSGVGGPGQAANTGQASAGGAGGMVNISYVATNVTEESTNYKLVGSNGADGDATAYCELETDVSGEDNSDTDSDEREAIGGVGGIINVYINTTTLITKNVVLDITTGSTGNADADACALCFADSDTRENFSVSTWASAEINGGDGADATININSLSHTIDNYNYTVTSGNAGLPEGYAQACGSLVGTVPVFCVDASSDVLGGANGITNFDISSSNITGDVFYLNITTGITSDSKADTAITCSGATTDSVKASENGKNSRYNNINIESTNGLLSNLIIDTDGAVGGDAEASCSESGTVYTNAFAPGGHGSGTYIYISSSDSFTTSQNIIMNSKNGGAGHDDWCDVPADPSPDGIGGNGGANYYNITSIILNNSKISMTEGDGEGTSAYGGDGGTVYIRNHGTSSFYNSNVTIVPGDGGAISGAGAERVGDGSQTYLYNYNTLNNYNSSLYLTGGDGGTGGCTSGGAGGDSIIYNIGTILYDTSSQINLTGGTGTCSNGGDALINSTGMFTIEDSSLFEVTGTNGTLHGDCENIYEGNFTIMNSIYNCTSLGAANIEGSNMVQVDFRNNSIFQLGGTGNTVNFTFTGLDQRFLLWNTSMDDTNIFWNNASATFGNRTEGSSGTLTFNESVGNTHYDEYYTVISDISIAKLTDTYSTSLYNYTNFTCEFKVDYDNVYNITTPKVHVFWYKDDVLSTITEEGIAISDNTLVNSTINITGDNTTLDESWKCSIKVNSSAFNTWENGTASTIDRTYPYNLNVSIGSLGLTDYYLAGQYNSSNLITFNLSSVNHYLQYICNSSEVNCSIPIIFSSSTTGALNITNINVTYGSSDTSSRLVTIPFKVSSDTDGQVNVTNPEFAVLDDEETNIKIVGRPQSGTGNATRYISVKYSDFNMTLEPSGVDYYWVQPYSRTQQDVTPFGQTSIQEIFKATPISTHAMNIYGRLRANSVPDCIRTTLNNISTNTLGWNITSSYQNIGMLNNSNISMWTWTDFSCTYDEIRTFYPFWDFKARAVGVVNESTFWE